jgi:hypothetical protein
MTPKSDIPGDAVDWEITTWEGHRRRQLNRWSGLSLDEILDAQEAMAVLAREIASAPVLSVQKPEKG